MQEEELWFDQDELLEDDLDIRHRMFGQNEDNLDVPRDVRMDQMIKRSTESALASLAPKSPGAAGPQLPGSPNGSPGSPKGASGAGSPKAASQLPDTEMDQISKLIEKRKGLLQFKFHQKTAVARSTAA